MKVAVFRKEHFNAAHRLHNPEWTDEKNKKVFGLCNNPNFHGHNYSLEVKVTGNPDPETGYVMDMKELSDIIKNSVLKRFDHKNLNLDVPFMKGKHTSTEHLAVAIWEQIESEIHKLGCELHCVKLQETENNFVEYYGK